MPEAQAKKPKSPPRTVWSGFIDGKQTTETSKHVSDVLDEAAIYYEQLAACGDEEATEIVEKAHNIASRYAKD